MKYFKIFLAVLVLTLVVGSLVYKNLLAPNDKSSPLARVAEMAIPIFMAFSLFMMVLKKREDKKGTEKLSEEDRKIFASIDHQK